MLSSSDDPEPGRGRLASPELKISEDGLVELPKWVSAGLARLVLLELELETLQPLTLASHEQHLQLCTAC